MSRPWVPAEGAELTERQLEYLRRMAEGESWQQIARALGITVAGVGSLSKQVLAKLGARSAAHAVHLAHKRRLLTRTGCGSHNGYRQHQRRREAACVACLAAEARKSARRRAAAREGGERS